MGEAARDLEQELIDEVLQYTHRPRDYMRFAFPWNEPETELERVSGPRAWQDELFGDLQAHLENPETRHQPFLAARASGHGIGKSACIGMLVNWGMSTCEDCKVVYTANTDTQLRTKTSPEIGKWFRLSITSHWFTVNATSIQSVQKGHEKSWAADGVPWSVNNTEAFAGLHNARKRIIVILDEASSIDDKVWEVIEGALTDEETEIIWIVFGNPTQNTGRFRECFGKYRHLWNTKQIDSREVEGTNKTQLQKMVDTYGEDSDIVKVRVRGMFPSTSAKQFISTEYVDRAYGREIRPEQYNFAPKIIGADPAWSGDDEFVITLRQGLRAQVLRVIQKNDDDFEMASLIAALEDEHKADAVFVDAGYGTGIVSAGKALGRKWRLVWFGGASADVGCLNKRAEMWKLMRDWLKDGGAIEKDPVLYQDLIGPETVAVTGKNAGKLQLESKDDMNARNVPSPNRADSLALTFAFPVTIKRPESETAKPPEYVAGGEAGLGWMG